MAESGSPPGKSVFDATLVPFAGQPEALMSRIESDPVVLVTSHRRLLASWEQRAGWQMLEVNDTLIGASWVGSVIGAAEPGRGRFAERQQRTIRFAHDVGVDLRSGGASPRASLEVNG